jgi:hypothetical protein
MAYIERIAVLAGGIEAGSGFLDKGHDWSSVAKGWAPESPARLPYPDDSEAIPF